MTVRDVQHLLEEFAPTELAWERDNVGLQCGSPDQRVRSILVTLDVTDGVVREARRKHIDLIVSHHPLLFHPLKSLDRTERIGRLLWMLVKAEIALYAIHTNLDFTANGVSFALAEQLCLDEIEVLRRTQQVFKKVVVFVPLEHVDRVLSSMARAGAGVIGKYDTCSFGTVGTGTFRPLEGAEPFLGQVGTLERVGETRLEMIVPGWSLNNVLTAMRQAHPYEEVAYDVYDLANASRTHGAGAIGNLRRALTQVKFLKHVQRILNVPSLRYCENSNRTIRRVAVCGGSGSDLLPIAIERQADAFVTSDITYHRFEESDGRILLVDAGHYETEQPAVALIARSLSTWLSRRGSDVQVFTSSDTTNPVHYFV